MDTTTFLNAVLADDGWYCIFAAKNGKVKQKLYETIDAASHVASSLNDNGLDVYFALSTFVTGDNRKAENVKLVKAFFLDLDCGDGKEYPDQPTALKRLQLFCKTHKLPRPTVVDSGRGLHIYWRLTEAVTYSQWKPVAERFKDMIKSDGMPMDVVVPADAARVLRVPNTNNYKTDPPSPVRLLGELQPAITFDDFADLLGDIPIPVPTLFEGAAVHKHSNSALMDTLLGNTQNSFKTILTKTLQGKGCEQLKIIATEQDDMSEPMWRAGLSIAKFCKDSEKAAEFLSKNYADYDEDETYNKLDLIKGPYLCETFDEYNPGVCKDCPNFGKIKSPIVLGREILEASRDDNVVPIKPEQVLVAPEFEDNTDVAVIPDYPKPYFRGKKGGVYISSSDADGNRIDKLVYENDLYAIKRIHDETDGESVVFRLHLPNDPMREFRIPIRALDTEEGKRILGYNGVVSHSPREIKDYTVNWVRELQQRISSDDAHMQFGWTKDRSGFVLGDKVYTDGGKIKHNISCSTTEQYMSFFNKKGTLEGWKSTMDFFNRPGMEMNQFVVAVGFGAPLVEFMPGITAAMLHLHNKDTGVGKSTSLLAMLSPWGEPKKLMVSDSGTKNFQGHRVAIYKNLPFAIDEVTNTNPEHLSQTTYDLTCTEGLERGRMGGSSNNERFRGEAWSYLAVTTGNTSIIERINSFKEMPKAEQQRILEWPTEKYHFDTVDETDILNQNLEDHYGHAGPVFMEYVMTNKELVKAMLKETKIKVDTTFNLTAANRFWSAYITCTMVGLEIAIRLGLLRYKYENVWAFARELIAANMEGAVKLDKTPSEVLIDYIATNRAGVMTVSNLNSVASKLAGNAPEHYRNNVVAKHNRTTNELMLLPEPFRKWCGSKQYNYNAEIKRLRDDPKFKLETKTAKFFSGTGVLDTTSVKVHVVHDFDSDVKNDGSNAA